MNSHEIARLYPNSSVVLRTYLSLRARMIDFDKLLAFLPLSVRTIQELGCGYGIASFMMAGKFPHRTIMAYDNDVKRIAFLAKINKYAHLKFQSINVLEVPEFRSDAILMVDLLHHLKYEDQEKLLLKIRTGLTSTGRVIIKDMRKGRTLAHFLNYLIDVLHTRELKFFYRTEDQFVRFFESCGFAIEEKGMLNKPGVPLDHLYFVLRPSAVFFRP